MAKNHSLHAMQIGINPLTWTNDDMPEIGAAIPLEQCLAEAHQAGYAGIELGHKFPRDARMLQPLLAKHHLQLVSGWYSLQLLERSVADEITALTPHLDLLTAMGCKIFIAADTSGAIHGKWSWPLFRRPHMPDDATWRQWADKLQRVADHIANHGLTMAYHHHMGTVIESASDIDQLMHLTRANAHVGLLFDTGHLTFAGADPMNVLERHRARVVHVHCKNVREPVLRATLHNNDSFLNAVLHGVFTVPGDTEGCVDFATILGYFARTHYKDWLVVEAEQDPAKAHPLTYATRGYKAVQQHIAALENA